MNDLRIVEYTLGKKKGWRTELKGTPLSRKPVELERAIQQAEALERGGKAEDVKAYALSETDIKQIIPSLKVVSYPDLLNATHIDQVLDPKGRLMLLYLTVNRSTGHWVCLLKRRGTKCIEYFDPYGQYRPDGEAKWLSVAKQKEFGQYSKHLSKLLNESPYKVLSNAYKFQKDIQDMNTCGRHCVTRLYLKHLSLPQYIDLIEKSGISPDDFVSGFTYNMIGR
jgi:hypothetical protein